MSASSDDRGRERLRQTFDRAALRYERARPEYPDVLFEALLAATGLEPGARLLEVGCATGKATVPLARRGFAMTCVELGAALAEVARARLAPFPAVEVVQGDFETWEPPEGQRFDLVFAATSWHWLDPSVRYLRAAQALRPGGFLAIWSATHVLPDGGDPFFAEIQEIYEEIGEGLPPGAISPQPGTVETVDLERDSGGLFTNIVTQQFDWETVHDADGYIDLLETFSGHIAMEPWQRERLYGEIRRRLEARPTGTLRRHWGVALEVAQLRDGGK